MKPSIFEKKKKYLLFLTPIVIQKQNILPMEIICILEEVFDSKNLGEFSVLDKNLSNFYCPAIKFLVIIEKDGETLFVKSQTCYWLFSDFILPTQKIHSLSNLLDFPKAIISKNTKLGGLLFKKEYFEKISERKYYEFAKKIDTPKSLNIFLQDDKFQNFKKQNLKNSWGLTGKKQISLLDVQLYSFFGIHPSQELSELENFLSKFLDFSKNDIFTKEDETLIFLDYFVCFMKSLSPEFSKYLSKNLDLEKFVEYLYFSRKNKNTTEMNNSSPKEISKLKMTSVESNAIEEFNKNTMSFIKNHLSEKSNSTIISDDNKADFSSWKPRFLDFFHQTNNRWLKTFDFLSSFCEILKRPKFFYFIGKELESENINTSARFLTSLGSLDDYQILKSQSSFDTNNAYFFLDFRSDIFLRIYLDLKENFLKIFMNEIKSQRNQDKTFQNLLRQKIAMFSLNFDSPNLREYNRLTFPITSVFISFNEISRKQNKHMWGLSSLTFQEFILDFKRKNKNYENLHYEKYNIFGNFFANIGKKKFDNDQHIIHFFHLNSTEKQKISQGAVLLSKNSDLYQQTTTQNPKIFILDLENFDIHSIIELLNMLIYLKQMNINFSCFFGGNADLQGMNSNISPNFFKLFKLSYNFEYYNILEIEMSNIKKKKEHNTEKSFFYELGSNFQGIGMEEEKKMEENEEIIYFKNSEINKGKAFIIKIFEKMKIQNANEITIFPELSTKTKKFGLIKISLDNFSDQKKSENIEEIIMNFFISHRDQETSHFNLKTTLFFFNQNGQSEKKKKNTNLHKIITKKISFFKE